MPPPEFPLDDEANEVASEFLAQVPQIQGLFRAAVKKAEKGIPEAEQKSWTPKVTVVLVQNKE